MAKPDDIPQDVWDAARHAASLGFTVPISGVAVVVSVAKAIMAERDRERERCARIADVSADILDEFSFHSDTDEFVAAVRTCEDQVRKLAKAIRGEHQ